MRKPTGKWQAAEAWATLRSPQERSDMRDISPGVGRVPVFVSPIRATGSNPLPETSSGCQDASPPQQAAKRAAHDGASDRSPHRSANRFADAGGDIASDFVCHGAG